MLRPAVIETLKARVAALGGRVYEAFLVPVDAGKPYASVKLAGERGSPSIGFAGDQAVEVRLYTRQTSFGDLDLLEGAVMAALNGKEITDSGDGNRYCVEVGPGRGDFVEADKIGRLLTFDSGVIHEPGGD